MLQMTKAQAQAKAKATAEAKAKAKAKTKAAWCRRCPKAKAKANGLRNHLQGFGTQ